MRRMLAIVLCFALTAGAPAAAAEAEIVEVEAAGIGTDADAAVKNALRNAVQQAVGVMVDSDTIIENDEVIADKILSHSAAYVQKHELIGPPEAKEGIVALKIKAQVKRTQLASGLAAEKIAVLTVSGENLGGEAMTKSESHKTGLEMLKEIARDMTDGCVAFAVDGAPRMDEKGEKVVVPIRFTLDEAKAKSMVDRLSDFLQGSALQAHKKERIKTSRTKGGWLKFPTQKFSGLYYFAHKEVAKAGVSLVTRINDDGTLTLWQDFSLTPEMTKAFRQLHNDRSLMRIELLGADGEAIDSKDFEYVRPYHINLNGSNEGWIHVMPFLASESEGFHARPGVAGAVRYHSFDLFADEIADIKDIRVSLVKQK